jgi:multidrug efflux system membrane fusion protein
MAGSYVYVIDKDEIVSRQGVSVGIAIDGIQEIDAGLDETSMVIVDGILRARPGSAVAPDTVNLDQAMRLIDPSAPPAETADTNGDA